MSNKDASNLIGRIIQNLIWRPCQCARVVSFYNLYLNNYYGCTKVKRTGSYHCPKRCWELRFNRPTFVACHLGHIYIVDHLRGADRWCHLPTVPILSEVPRQVDAEDPGDSRAAAHREPDAAAAARSAASCCSTNNDGVK